VHGKAVYNVRKAMGAELAREVPVAADVVVPVPDSGVPAALGFAQHSGIPFELGLVGRAERKYDEAEIGGLENNAGMIEGMFYV